MTSRRYLLALLAVAFLVPIVLVTGSGAEILQESTDSAIELQDGADVDIEEGLTETQGERTLVVRLSDVEERPTISNEGMSVSTEQLKEHAASTQKNVAQFASSRDDVEIENRFWITNAVVLTVDTDAVPVDRLARLNHVEQIHADFEVETESTSASPVPSTAFDTQDSVDTTYGVDQVNAPDAWADYTTQGEDVRVAVLDTGVDVDHDDIDLYTEDENDETYPGGWAEFDSRGNLVSGSQPHDTGSHGTHVSGIVAGGNAAGTYIGVAPETELMHGLVMPDDGGSFSQILGGMEWAVENDADVMTMSMGIDGYYSSFIDPIRTAENQGTVVIASIGNDGEGSSSSPGNEYDSLGVGASDSDENIAGFSGGELIDTDSAWGSSAPDDWPEQYVVPSLAAPGSWVPSAVPGNEYQSKSGTSMAAPHVAGATALVQSATDSHKSPDEIKDALEATAWKPGDWDESDAEDAIDSQDSRYGHGIIDAHAAIEYLKDGSDTDPEPAFDVTSATLDETTILEGETVTVSADVENTGDADGTFTADLYEDGVVIDTEEVTVDAGSTETVTFEETYQTPGTYDLVVDDTTAGTLTVEEATAEFDVSDTSLTDETILEGETAEVTATIENTGDAEGDFEAEFRLTDADGTVSLDSTTVTLAAGTSTTVTLAATVDESGTYDADVSGEPAGTLQVDQPALFELSAGSLSDDEIEAGDSVTASATVENVGDREDTFTAKLRVDDTREQTTDVTLAGGASETVSFTYEPPESGEYTVDLVGDDNDGGETVTAAGTLSVLEPAAFEVTDSAISHTEILDGETTTATATVENTGEIEGTFTATLQVTADGTTDVRDRQDVTLAGGEASEVTFEERFDEPGEYEVAISDAAAGTLTVTEATPEFETSGVTLSEGTIPEGVSIIVEATVENVGTGPGEHEATLTVDGDQVSTATVTLDAGESTTVSFEETFHDAGSYTITVDDAAGETLTVEQPATFDVVDTDLGETTVEEGENVDVTATVENVGDREGELTVELHVAGSATGSVTKSIPSGESATVTFTESFDDAGEYEISIDGDGIDAETVGTVTVEAQNPAAFEVRDAQLLEETILDGEQATAEATVENTGDETGTFTAELQATADGVTEVRDTQDIEIAGGETDTATLTETFTEPGTYQIQISDARAGELTVEQPATFELSEAALASSEIETGESIDVTATVQNTGDRAGEYTAELSIGDSTTDVVDTVTVELNPGESTVLALSHTVEEAGEYDVVLDETQVGTVDVLAPADLSIADAYLDTQSINEGETVTVTATVENTGDLDGSMTLTVGVDSQTVAEREVTVDGGAETTETVEHTFDAAGEYEVTVNDDHVGTVEVSEPSPAAFELSNVDLEPETLVEGESIQATATVENVGDETGTFSAELQVDTAVHASEDVPLDPGETTVLELETTIDDAGEYEVAIGETVAGTVTVEQPAMFEITDVMVDSNTVAVSDTVEVEVTVRNQGDRVGTTPVVLSNDASPVDETPVTVSGGERTTVTLTWSPNGGDLGENTLTAETADDTDTVEVAVEPNRNNRNVVAYTDDDGVLQTDGLRTAIDDWRQDEVETDLLRDVIDAWRQGEPIE